MDYSQLSEPAARKVSKLSPVQEDDYSSSVRKRLSASSRTGQACDRCKVRKIRCDPTIDGCTPCRTAQTPCKTTDRITGKATTRGHTDVLEVENRILKAKLQEYQQKLSDLGVSLADLQGSASNNQTTSPAKASSQQYWDQQQDFSLPHRDAERRDSKPSHAGPSSYSRLLDSRPATAMIEPNFVMLRGTKLSLFGMQMDLAEFADDPSDVDSPQTYDGFMKHAFGKTQLGQSAPLPDTLQSAQEYALWYFKFLHPYTPVIDKRDMHELLVKVYSDPMPGPRTGRTAAEEVMIHMMFAQIKYQYGQRNQVHSMLDEAMAHFKYSLSLFPDLVRGQSLQDVQALTMIAIQVRTFPKPGAAWYCSHLALCMAIELGLHRSAEFWSAVDQRVMGAHENEMRKRVFWTLYGLVSSLGGRLGRPIPLRLSDIDIEFPSAVPDNLPEESDLPEFRKCSFLVGNGIVEILAITAELYTTMYSASGSLPQDYDAIINKFEADLKIWRSRLHPELIDYNQAEGETQVCALYLELTYLECQFLLRHPLNFPPNQPEAYKQNLNHTLDTASKTLAVLTKLKDAKCLDVPWYNVTVFLAMIFTTLFAEDQRREELTAEELRRLKSEMDQWVIVLGDIGIMLGSGFRLQQFVGHIMHNSLSNLSKQLANRALSHNQQTTYHPTTTANTGSAEGKHEQSSYVAADRRPFQPDHAYASTTPTYDLYGPGVQPPQPTYVVAQAAYAQPSYNPLPTPESARLSQPLIVPSLNTANTNSAFATTNPYFPTHDVASTTPATEWLRWQANINPVAPHAGQQQQQQHQQQQMNYMSPANTLMTLGSRAHGAGVDEQTISTAQDMQWPTNLYHLSLPANTGE
ncbi:hypothetical protein FKW77_008197 [Venturia effusa]|uniref:Zn(2)-C6 fungal-type domain-containing protein n=1 Tax=Venturia effusa TaxID=50376 RepID=A0A517L3T8_9PEZI|nr:hypothetical protein FKW77_008197 [Venturia effusa]